MIEEGKYIGNELELFERAHHWKSYFSKIIKPYLKGDILEVGAGIGGTTMALCDGSAKSWLCLEPDPQLASQIEDKISKKILPALCTVKSIYSGELGASELFDAVLYMDVIEHIEDDNQELVIAFNHLKPGGKLIILVPAHQSLYTPFDKKIGHFRRYSKKRLQQAIPGGLKMIRLNYLDSVGLMASLTNKFFLKSSMPTQAQVKIWDSYMVPVSKIFDKVFGYSIGKSVLGIWTKP